ncbi:hypothetical protein FRC03_001561 [Tulasnella sp. 419]|nr:hypothetical protein FRC03_001561 [Tulasnella sp. 419]
MGISIWLMPDPAARQTLKTVISKLSEKHQSPAFEPHITLLSLPSDIVESAHPLALLGPDAEKGNGEKGYFPHRPFPVVFKRLTTGRTFFQSVLIEVDSPEKVDEEVNMLEYLSNSAYSWNGKTAPYYPHLSLYYGEPPVEVKSQIVAELKADNTVTTNNDGTLDVGGLKNGFDVTEVWVVRTEGPVEGWEVVGRLSL